MSGRGEPLSAYVRRCRAKPDEGPDWLADRVAELEQALCELHAGALDDSMPGSALLEWHERYPWANDLVDGC